MLEEFVRGYNLAIAFEGDEIKAAPFSLELTEKITADCKEFIKKSAGLIPEREAAHAGIDFWLTRNGAGAGYWDGEWPEHGEKLTELARSFGACEVYVGDDGFVYYV